MFKKLEKNRAVIYDRYSSSSQQEISVGTQLRECQEYAEKHDYFGVV